MLIFSVVGYMGMFVVIFLFIFEFVGDYFVVFCFFEVLVLFFYVINRGIFIEGFVSIIFGLMGVGYVIILYSGNIGIIGIIKVSILIKFNVLIKFEFVWDDVIFCFLFFK